jgi:long-chain acyl-CoA synthetase
VNTAFSADEPTSLVRQLVVNAHAHPTRVAARKRDLGIWKEYTNRDVLERVAAATAGLHARGLNRGDRIAIVSGNRPAWLFAELAAQALGAVTVGVEPWVTSSDLGAVLQATGCIALVAEDEEQYDKAMEVRRVYGALRHIVVVDVEGFELSGEGVVSLADVEVAGRAAGGPETFDMMAGAIDTMSPATLLCGRDSTSASAVLRHRDLVVAAREISTRVGLQAQDDVFSYVPLAELTERSLSIGGVLVAGGVVNFGAGPAALAADLRAIQPSVLYLHAATWDLVANAAQAKMRDASGLKRRLYRAARLAGEKKPGSRRYWLLVDRSLREKLGMSRLRSVSTNTGVSPAAVAFYASLGIPTVELTPPLPSELRSPVHAAQDDRS